MMDTTQTKGADIVDKCCKQLECNPGMVYTGSNPAEGFHPQHYTTHYCHWQITLALLVCCWNLKTFHTAKITSVCCHIDTNVGFVVLQLLPCSA